MVAWAVSATSSEACDKAAVVSAALAVFTLMIRSGADRTVAVLDDHIELMGCIQDVAGHKLADLTGNIKQEIRLVSVAWLLYRAGSVVCIQCVMHGGYTTELMKRQLKSLKTVQHFARSMTDKHRKITMTDAQKVNVVKKGLEYGLHELAMPEASAFFSFLRNIGRKSVREAAVQEYHRLFPHALEMWQQASSPQSEEQIKQPAAVLSDRDCYMNCLMGCLVEVKNVSQKELLASNWWPDVYSEVVRVVVGNEHGRLRAQTDVLRNTLAILQFASSMETYRSRLLADTQLLRSVEFACTYRTPVDMFGNTSSQQAVALACALHGKNEKGVTLNGSVIMEMVESKFVDLPNLWFSGSLKVASHLEPLASIAVSDANKPHILAMGDRLIDVLLDLLLVRKDHPLFADPDAGPLVGMVAGIIQELALFGPGSAVLRAHPSAADTLRILAKEGRTKESRQKAEQVRTQSAVACNVWFLSDRLLVITVRHSFSLRATPASELCRP